MAYTADTKCLSPCCPANNYQTCYESSEDYSVTSEAPTSADSDDCNEFSCEDTCPQKMYHRAYDSYSNAPTLLKKQSKCIQKYSNDFQNYYDERTDFMTKKFNDLNLTNDMSNNCKVCPVHSKTVRKKSSDIYTIEETYWAMWKPNKKNSEVNMEKKAEPIPIPRFDSAPNPMRSRSSFVKSFPPVTEIQVPNQHIGNYIQCRKCMKYIEKNTSANCYKCNHLQSESLESLNRKHNTINEDDEDVTHGEYESGELETLDDATDISVCKSKKSDKSRKSRVSTASRRSNDTQNNKSRGSDKGKITDYLNKIMNGERPRSPSYGVRQENKENVCDGIANENDKEMNYRQTDVKQIECPRSPSCKQRPSSSGSYGQTEGKNQNSRDSRHSNEDQNNLVSSRQNLDTAVFQVLKEKLRTSNTSPMIQNSVESNQTDNLNTENNANTGINNDKEIIEKENIVQTPKSSLEETKVVDNNAVNSPEIIVTKPPDVNFEANSNTVDENEMHSLNYNNIQELEVITLKHTNSYIRKLGKVDEPVKTYNQPATLKLSTMNRVNVIRPHSYPLKPILKKDKKFIPTSRPQSNTKNFSFKYKQ